MSEYASRIRALLPRVVQAIERRHGSVDSPTSIKTGFKQLDARTGGLRAGELTVIAGARGMGRTAFVMNLAAKACESGHPVLFFIPKHSKEWLSESHHSSHTTRSSARI